MAGYPQGLEKVGEMVAKWGKTGGNGGGDGGNGGKGGNRGLLLVLVLMSGHLQKAVVRPPRWLSYSQRVPTRVPTHRVAPKRAHPLVPPGLAPNRYGNLLQPPVQPLLVPPLMSLPFQCIPGAHDKKPKVTVPSLDPQPAK